MTTTAPYRSTQSVPDRVDAAWTKGYAAGLSEAKRDLFRTAGVALVVALAVELRRRRFHLSSVVLIACVVALVTVPVMVTVLVIRAAWRAHHRRRRVSLPPAAAVVLDDGTTF